MKPPNLGRQKIITRASSGPSVSLLSHKALQLVRLDRLVVAGGRPAPAPRHRVVVAKVCDRPAVHDPLVVERAVGARNVLAVHRQVHAHPGIGGRVLVVTVWVVVGCSCWLLLGQNALRVHRWLAPFQWANAWWYEVGSVHAPGGT